MDVGLFLLRVVVGGLLVGHGTRKLVGWFGGSGLDGTAGFFAQLDYRAPRTMAAVAGGTETGAGLALFVGLLTPLASAAVIGVMINAAAAHRRAGLWNADGGFELPLVFAGVATGLAFTGPGGASFDAGFGRATWSAWWGAIAVLVGVVAGVAFLTMAREDDLTRAGQPEEPAPEAAERELTRVG